MHRRYCKSILVIILVYGTAAIEFAAGAPQLERSVRSWAANVIVPQTGAYSMGARCAVRISEIRAGAVIVEQVATTTLEISIANPCPVRQETELLVPVPDGAAVRGFDFQGAGREALRSAATS
jgi:hypothetical protein